MPEPRVLPVVGTRIGRKWVPEWPGRGRPAPPQTDIAGSTVQRWIAWRLLAGNGWEIARSASVFPDPQTCRGAVVALTNAIGRSEWTATRGLRPDAWSWELMVDGTLAAVASRFYKLQRECESAVRTFLTVLPSAVLPREWSSSRPLATRHSSPVLPDERTAFSGRRIED